MASAVIGEKIDFFDTNPSGRLLNRFSADIGSNDDLLPITVFGFFVCALLVGGSLITAVVAIPFILIIMPPLIWYFLRVWNIFVVASRELKRIEGLSRSPIYAMLNESICGVATIPRISRYAFTCILGISCFLALAKLQDGLSDVHQLLSSMRTCCPFQPTGLV